jgi:sugar lactone lactonase YvrE
MTTTAKIIRQTGGLRRAGGVLAGVLFAAVAQAQPQMTTVISNLFEPSSITSDPANNIYFTDASDNRIVEFVPTTNGVFTFAGSATYQAGYNNSVYTDQALFSQPLGIVYDQARGGLVVVDQVNQVLRLITSTNGVTKLAGVQSNPDGGFVNGAPAVAQFSYPTGIATDNTGNLYVADTGNNAIRRVNSTNGVETVQVNTYAFSLPQAVAVDTNNNLWVADTGNDVVCVISNISVITNQSVHVIAGTRHHTGTNDSVNASSALFNEPAGLLWDPNGAGLLISDTGNNTVRRLYANTTRGGFSVETVAGQPTEPGSKDGPISVAQLNAPTGMAVDTINNGYYIVDQKNNALRRYQTGPPLPPVTTPQIGIVSFPLSPQTGAPASSFSPLPYGGIFNTNNVITIYNTDSDPNVQTYYVVTNTPVDPFAPAPLITTNSHFAPNYPGDGSAETTPLDTTLNPLPLPYQVTMYAQSFCNGRAPSPVVKATFTYVTAPPVIGGNDGAAVELTDLTSPSTMWYTLNGTPPTVHGAESIGPITSGSNISFGVYSNMLLSVQAFSPGFAPSVVVTQVFEPSNYVATQITFGFAAGEASSQFVGAPGQRFYAPVTLSLLPGTTMYGLQFNVTVTNLSSAPAVGQTYQFDSMLQKPIQVSGATLYIPIPPDTFTNGGLQSLVFTNSNLNLLGVGWLEIPPETNLYNTLAQNLITYSMAHETLYPNASAPNSVIVGGYSFEIPLNAANNQVYQIQLGRPSADGDGFTQNVLMQTPTNGSLGPGTVNAIKNVTVGVIPYLVGDVAPFRWFNAGDFGDTNILNNDVLDVFRSSVYLLNTPPVGSDFYDAMDSSDGSFNNYYTETDAQIDSMQLGDGQLDVTDVYVTFRRSLDPSLHWVERYWSNGIRQAQYVTNEYKTPEIKTPKIRALDQPAGGGAPRYITVAGDTVQAGGSLNVQVPVRVLAADSLPIRVLAMNVDIIPLDGSPAVTNTISFSPAAGLGTPYTTLSQGLNNYAATWLDSSAAGVPGTSVIGTVRVTLPPSVNPNSSYLVHFEHFSASPNGLALFHSTVTDGLITVGNRTGSSWGDGIPDTWRLIYFGTISNLLSAANLDPDGDGASNWQEYVAGTNPMDPTSALKLMTSGSSPNFSVQWPSVPGKTYMVQSSASLFSTNWTILASNLPGTGMMMQFADTNAPAPPASFYRVQAQ